MSKFIVRNKEGEYFTGWGHLGEPTMKFTKDRRLANTMPYPIAVSTADKVSVFTESVGMCEPIM